MGIFQTVLKENNVSETHCDFCIVSSFIAGARIKSLHISLLFLFIEVVCFWVDFLRTSIPFLTARSAMPMHSC